MLADVTSDMKVAREETFGPVAPLFRFREDAEAVRMANDTEFGLAAYFYSRDIAGSGIPQSSLNTAWSASIPASSRPR